MPAKLLVKRNPFRTPPSWVAEAVIYQIVPDRFRRSGLVKAQDQLELRPWGTDPAAQGFHGGDLHGVIESLAQLQDMGITCLYLTPIFSSASNHRYHTFDYLQVDPLLGGNAALDALISAVGQRGMRLVLDGVFNHCGRGFWAFHHLVENGEGSPYRDWFHVHRWPLRPYPAAGEDCGYSCWWSIPDLPKFNHDHPAVQDYLLQVGRHWLNRGIDGWRLDVPAEVPATFWVAFRKMVRSVNPEAWIVGEIWGDARPWLGGDHFDGVMNYRLGWSSLCWAAGGEMEAAYSNPDYPLKPLAGEDLIAIWETTSGWYSPEVNQAQMNLLDSHDVPRALHSLKGDVNALKLALLLLFLQPGAPCIYYGTEAGLSGGPEPACREAFPWDVEWNVDLCRYIQELARLRKRHPQLRENGLRWFCQGPDGLRGEGSNLWVLVNRSRSECLQPPSGMSGSLEWQSGSVSPAGLIGPQSAALLLL